MRDRFLWFSRRHFGVENDLDATKSELILLLQPDFRQSLVVVLICKEVDNQISR